MPENIYQTAYDNAASAYWNSDSNWFGDMTAGMGFADGRSLMDDNARNYMNTMQTNALNYQAFLENRDYMASREDNAIQRQVSDMKKAGLNPAMLSSVPSGASSSAGSSQIANAKVPQLINVNLESSKQNQKGVKTFLDFFTRFLTFGLSGD